MGLSKTILFTEHQNKVASITKALGHPARIAILEHLSKVQGCICGDLVDVLPLSQSTISQHLKELRKAGLIQGEIEGVKTCYCINQKNWLEIKNLLNLFFEKVNTSCCG